ncbi:hypothetical protein VII00023_12723 [Vibrio ichthyoenteri ATCC 700023]|uniref:Uncharacterized protein n=1 Tax=Vibrio ichthyoenteri ATCC 700023 TaxID=870968 RepID=F9S2D5_9VIBR|nr:hypothetical protein VII00023_12723 [Vibrio ichthyoenteri ATCC 700023]
MLTLPEGEFKTRKRSQLRWALFLGANIHFSVD